MKKQTWWLVAVLALAMMLSFTACEEDEDPIGPDSTDSFVGLWVRSALTVEGQPVDVMSTVQLNADSTGRMWLQDVQSGNRIVQNMTWSVLEGDSLEFDMSLSGLMYASYAHDGDNNITLTFEYEGETRVDEMVRWTGEIDQRLVGNWEMSSQTINGEPIDPDNVFLQFSADGTAQVTDEDGLTNFFWSVEGNQLIHLRADTLGYVVDYAAGGSSFTVTQHQEGQLYVMGFVHAEVPEGLDEEIFGVWVQEPELMGEEQEMRLSVNTFLANGTGSRTESEEDTSVTMEFNYSTSNDTLYVIDEENNLLYSGVYSITGNRLELVEIDEDTPDPEVYWRYTGDHPAGVTGIWIQNEMVRFEEGVEYEIGVTVDLRDDGSAIITSWGMARGEFEEWDDWEEVQHYFWSMTDNRLLLIEEMSNLGMALQLEIDGNSATLIDPEGLTRHFDLFEGDNPTELLGTWVVYGIQFNGEDEEFNGSLVVTLEGDGNATFSQVNRYRNQDDVEIVEYDSYNFLWVSRDGVFYMIEPEHGGEIMSYTLEGEFLTIHSTEFHWQQETFIPMNVQFVRESGDLDENLFGTWIKTGETIDGVENPDFDPVTLVFQNDGSGNYTEQEESEEFTWTSNAGYLIPHTDSDDGTYEVVEAIAYGVDSSQMIFTEFERSDENNMQLLVEIFTRE